MYDLHGKILGSNLFVGVWVYIVYIVDIYIYSIYTYCIYPGFYNSDCHNLEFFRVEPQEQLSALRFASVILGKSSTFYLDAFTEVAI